MENLNKKIYELLDKELADLMIGYSFNASNFRQIVDLIAELVVNQPYITELFEKWKD